MREAAFSLPAAAAHDLVVVADRADVEVDLPGALRVTREVVDGRMRVSAVQGAQRAVRVRWRRAVQALDAELVFTSRADTIARLSPGTLRTDSVVSYAISQGTLERLELRVPRGLSVTQVHGAHLRDWRREVREGDDGKDGDRLVVTLSRPQRAAYALQVIAEAPVPALPTPLALPMIEPVGGLRAEGYLTVGTDSAIQLVVEASEGLAQVDGAEVPRVALREGEARPVPKVKAFSYRYAALPARMRLALSRVRPGYDAVHRVVVRVGPDDLTVEAQVELDVRDAPLRAVTLRVPAGLTVVGVVGPAVEDYQADPGSGSVVVRFSQPVRGRTTLGLRLERGSSPMVSRRPASPKESVALEGWSVEGARTQRGFVTLAAEAGVDLADVASEGLREVGVAAAPMRVDDARRAWRLEGPDVVAGLHAAFASAAGAERDPAPADAGRGHRVREPGGELFDHRCPHGHAGLSGGSPAEQRVVCGAGRAARGAGRRRSGTLDGDAAAAGDRRLQPGGHLHAGLRGRRRTDRGGGALRRHGVAGGGAGDHQPVESAVESRGADGSGLLPVPREEVPVRYRRMIGTPLLASFRYAEPVTPIRVQVAGYDRGTLLPAVIELTRIETGLVPRSGDEAESLTTVVYKIKNASSQFWPCRCRRGPACGPRGCWGTRASARGWWPRTMRPPAKLLIPLERPRDPNAPITLEVRYGQVHAGGGDLALAAPAGSVVGTFDHWRVTAPAGWALRPGAGGMSPRDRVMHHGRLDRLVSSVGAAWGQALTRASGDGRALAIAALLLLGLGVLWAATRRVPTRATVAVVGVLALWLGLGAMHSDAFAQRVSTADDLTTLDFTQVLSGDGSGALAIDLQVTPAWRQHAGWVGTAGLAGLSIGLLVAAGWARRWRSLAVAAGLTGLLIAGAHLPALSVVWGHALTWGLPAVLLVGVAWTLWRERRWAWPGLKPTAATAGLLLAAGMGLGLGGCAARPATTTASDGERFERVELDLSAETDAVVGEMRVELDAPGPGRLALLESGAVLLSADTGPSDARVVLDDGATPWWSSGPGGSTRRCAFSGPWPRPTRRGDRR